MPITQKEYLSKRGNLKDAYSKHKKIMIVEGKSFVTYSSFRHRVHDLNWDLYKAIHTPAVESHRDRDRRRKVRLYNIIYRVKKFFRRLVNL